MRVVEVHPTKEPRRFHGVEPRQRAFRDLACRTLDVGERRRLVLRKIEVIEVRVEALGNSPGAVEHVRADESAGLESLCFQAFGQRRLALVEEEAAVVANTMMRRI